MIVAGMTLVLDVNGSPKRLALAREAGARSIVLLKNATTTRKDGSTGPLLPIAVPPAGDFRVLVVGPYGTTRTSTWAATRPRYHPPDSTGG